MSTHSRYKLVQRNALHYTKSMMSKKKGFGRLVSKYRKERLKENQDQMGEHLGKPREYISMIETGAIFPTYEFCDKLAALFRLEDGERKEFYAAAAGERLINWKANTNFYKEVGEPRIIFEHNFEEMTRTTEEDDIIAIPIFDYPDKKIAPPFEDHNPGKFIKLSNMFTSNNYYALFYRETYSTNELNFRAGDLIFIDPLFDRINSGDIVLVKIYDEVVFRRYSILQIEEEFKIQFLPFPTAGQPYFDIKEDILVTL